MAASSETQTLPIAGWPIPKALARHHSLRGERVPEILDPHVVKPRGNRSESTIPAIRIALSGEQVEPDDARLHAAIASNLEPMQTDLTALLTRWREFR